MALRNRVTPFGEILALPGRGSLMGNRGILHDAQRNIVRDSQVRRWIACLLEFRGQHRRVMTAGSYTELFFLDEAAAFAAGHRPCAECRREDYNRYLETIGERRADDLDERLHAERMGPHPQSSDLPDGAFVLREDEPWLVLGDELLR